MELTKRRIKILEIVVNEYTATAQPVGSQLIQKKYLPDISPQTIRNELLYLEENGFLEKMHTSSGRIPSHKGFEYYRDHLMRPVLRNDIKRKLQEIFNNRLNNIDETINDSVSLITDLLHLPAVLTSNNCNEHLAMLKLIRLTPNEGLIIMVTSGGSISKLTVPTSNEQQFQDVSTCIQILNERLLETRMDEIEVKMNAMLDIISQQVSDYEYTLQNVITRLLNHSTKSFQDVLGFSQLTNQPEFSDHEKLCKVLGLLENSSVWTALAHHQDATNSTTITLGSQFNMPDIAIARTNIHAGETTKQICLVGPARMDYNQVKAILDFIKENIENNFCQPKQLKNK